MFFWIYKKIQTTYLFLTYYSIGLQILILILKWKVSQLIILYYSSTKYEQNIEQIKEMMNCYQDEIVSLKDLKEQQKN